MNILILTASSNKNLELARKFQEELKKFEGVELDCLDLTTLDLPLFSSQKEESEGIPEKAKEWGAKLEKFQGLVILSPEYNGGVPPVFTNFLAWISRSGKDWRNAFNEKPVVIGTHSGSGGVNLLNALRVQLSYLGMNVIGRQIHTHFSKALNQDSLKNVVGQLVHLLKSN